MRSLLASLCVSALVVGCSRAPKPDIIVVTWDTVRADRAGPESVVPDLTPNLNALAARGVRFIEARTPVPITLPAHSALFTGLRPDETGVRTNGLFALKDDAVTLAERAQEAGYATGAFVSAAVLAPEYGLAQGFDTYDANVGDGGAGGMTFAQRTAGPTIDAAIAWLRGRPADTPVFLWVHLFDPHLPLEAPLPYSEAHPDDGYAAEIAYTDAETGRLLRNLAAVGRADTSVVIVTSDHGEGLGEHGEATHAYFAYDSTLRIPLVVAAGARSGVTTRTGAAVSGPASLTDLAPTLVELLGWDPMPTSGVSLAKALTTGEALPPRELYVECAEPAFAFGTAPVFGVIDTEGDSWFDLPRREQYAHLDGGQLENRYEHDTMAMQADARFGRIPRAWPPRVERSLSAAEIERLAALGYVGGGSTSAVHDVGEGPDPKDLLPIAALVMADRPTLAPETAAAETAALRAEFGPVPILAMLQADALEAMGRRSEAIAALEEPAKTYPSEQRLQTKLADFRAAEAEDRALLTAVRAARAERPEDVGVWFDLAFVLHRLGELDEARTLYTSFLAAKPDDGEARVNLARVAGALGTSGDAVAVLRAHPESDVRVICSLARTLRRDATDDRGLDELRACRDAGGELRADELAAVR